MHFTSINSLLPLLVTFPFHVSAALVQTITTIDGSLVVVTPTASTYTYLETIVTGDATATAAIVVVSGPSTTIIGDPVIVPSTSSVPHPVPLGPGVETTTPSPAHFTNPLTVVSTLTDMPPGGPGPVQPSSGALTSLTLPGPLSTVPAPTTDTETGGFTIQTNTIVSSDGSTATVTTTETPSSGTAGTTGSTAMTSIDSSSAAGSGSASASALSTGVANVNSVEMGSVGAVLGVLGAVLAWL